jgi:hypothetical protein
MLVEPVEGVSLSFLCCVLIIGVDSRGSIADFLG